jgi:hypothetical protein
MTSTSPVLNQKVKKDPAANAVASFNSSGQGQIAPLSSNDSVMAVASGIGQRALETSAATCASLPTNAIVDQAIGTLQDDPAIVSPLDELANELISLRGRRSRIKQQSEQALR